MIHCMPNPPPFPLLTNYLRVFVKIQYLTFAGGFIQIIICNLIYQMHFISLGNCKCQLVSKPGEKLNNGSSLS